MIWSYLLHLSYNMWCDRDVPGSKMRYNTARPYLRCDDSLWHDLMPRMAQAGINMVIIDVGDGVRYRSHRDIAVEGAWSRRKLRQELARMRDLGLEPIPKLNFSTCHDAWLGRYSRMVSTDIYYRVCRDLIAEVIELFGGPRFFHLGMDEEIAYPHQRNFAYLVVRQFELWWHDLNFYVEQVEQGRARPWVWSDYVWHHPDEFYQNMPASVLQSNWYYGLEFNGKVNEVQAYADLDRHGYDQVPTGSNYDTAGNFQKTVRHCVQHVAPERLLGFMHAPWRPTLEECCDSHLEAIGEVAQARRMLR
jgi:hypothetical protein